MNARQRYIVGTWASVGCIVLALLAVASWSHFHSSHHELLHIMWGCAQTGGFDDKCEAPYRVVTTANRAPAVGLAYAAAVAGFLAMYCFTSSDQEHEPMSSRS